MSITHSHQQQHSQHQCRVHICTSNNTANISVDTHMHQQQQSQHQYPVDISSATKPTSVHIHTSNNRASIRVQYIFIPATTEPAPMSRKHSYQQQQSQHQGPVHIHTSNNRASIRVQYQSYQQQQSQHQGPVHSHTSNNRASIRVQYTVIPATTKLLPEEGHVSP